MNKILTATAILIVTFLIGLSVGYALFYPKSSPIVYKPEIRLKDSSIVLKSDPDTVIKIQFVKVDGTSVLNQGVVKILPHAADTTKDIIQLGGDTVLIVKTVGIDTVEMSYNILKDKDGGIRVQLKAKGGTIIGGVDVPRSMFPVAKPYKHTVGLWSMYDVIDRQPSAGAFVGVAEGPITITGMVGTRIKQLDHITAGIQLGARF